MSIARPHGLPHADTVYRDPALGARLAVGQLIRQHRRQLDLVGPNAGEIYAARTGRIAAGVALILGALALVAVLVARSFASLVVFDGAATVVLLASWPLALIARGVGHAIGRRRFAILSHRALAMSGDAYPDLVRLRQLDVAAQVRVLVGRHEAASVGLPLAGLALLAPLTLHFLLMAANGVSLAGFETWILISALIVGHCHIVLAALSWRFGRALSSDEDLGIDCRRGWQAWRITVATSFFPGIFLIGIPVFTVAVTGLFIPVMFSVAQRLVEAERARLENIS